MSKHTPGPWASGFKFCSGYEFEIRPEAGIGATSGFAPIARIVGDKRTTDDSQRIANARLIAAAPELLEALRDLVQLEADGRTEYESAIEYWERARAAISKALGEQA